MSAESLNNEDNQHLFDYRLIPISKALSNAIPNFDQHRDIAVGCPFARCIEAIYLEP